MGKELTYLDHRTTMNAAKLMKNNIIVGGVQTSPDLPPPREAFIAFLHNLLQITAQDNDILDVVALGGGYTKLIEDREVHFPPPLKANCSELLASRIMNNASKLKGKSDQEGGFKYYVKRSKPEPFCAVHEKYAQQVKQYREQNENAETDEEKTDYYFSGTRFFINKKVVEEDITPSTPKDMMHLSDEVLTAMEQVQFASSQQKDLQLSKLQAFATKVSTTDDIDLAYMKMHTLHHYVDHILLGYRIQAGNDIQQGCTSDRQHYGDQEVLKAMKKYRAINTVVFLVWEYGGIPLGGARFKNICSLTTHALRELQPETLEAPAPLPHPQCENKGRGTSNKRGTPCHHPPRVERALITTQRTETTNKWLESSMHSNLPVHFSFLTH